MFVFHSLLLACAFLLFDTADCTPFHRRGNDSTAPGWNYTTTSTSSAVVALPLIPTTSVRTTSLLSPTSSPSSEALVPPTSAAPEHQSSSADGTPSTPSNTYDVSSKTALVENDTTSAPASLNASDIPSTTAAAEYHSGTDVVLSALDSTSASLPAGVANVISSSLSNFSDLSTTAYSSGPPPASAMSYFSNANSTIVGPTTSSSIEQTSYPTYGSGSGFLPGTGTGKPLYPTYGSGLSYVSSTGSVQPPYPTYGSGLSYIPGTGTVPGTGKPGSGSGTGRAKPTAQGLNSTTASRNNTGLCTVNVPNANVDWWYAATLDYAIGTLTRVGGNFTDAGQHLTYIPNTETFDIASATAEVLFTPSVTFDSEYNFTYTLFTEYSVQPAASVTSFVSQTAYVPLPSDGVILEADFSNYEIDVNSLPSATLDIGAGLVATSATPLLYFTAYEVVTVVSGKLATETVNLPEAYALSYDVKGIEDSAIVTGTVPAEFLQQIPQSACSAGILQATVTVVFVVDISYIYFPHVNPFIVHVESSADGFEDLTTDEPSPIATSTSKRPSTAANSPHHPEVQQTLTSRQRTRMVNLPAPQTTTTATVEPSQHTVGVVGSQTIVVESSSVVVVGSQTLQPGGPAVTVSGVPISLAPSATAIVIGSDTSSLPQVAVPVASSQQPAPVLTIGASTLTGNAATQFFVGPGQTLTPGGTATVDGTVVSLGPSASFIVIGSSTQALPAAVATITQKPDVIVGGSTVTANVGSSFVISGQTLAPGQQITVGGTTLSLAPSASFVVVNGATSTLAPVVPQPVITVGGSTFTGNSGSTFVMNGQTLSPNQVVTVDGTAISLGPSASFVVVGGATSTFTNPATARPEITVGGSTFTAGPATSFIIDGQTLVPGQVVTVHGTAISLGPSASFVVVGGVTSTLANPSAGQPVITVGGSTFTANPDDTFVIDGQTLVPGKVVTVDGTTLSLGRSASFVVVDGVTSTLTHPAFGQPVITLEGSTFTATSGGTFVIGGQTLRPGQVVTVDGKTISLGPSASVVVINGVTSTLSNSLETVRPELILGGTTLEPEHGTEYVVDGTTLSPGQVITLDGTTISLGPSASYIVINGVTSTLVGPEALITAPPLTIGNGVFTALPGTGTTYMIGSYYLTPGGIITVAGTTISLTPGGTALIVNGKTTYLSATVSAPITNPPLLTIGTQTFTAVPGAGTTFLIDGQTLTPGGTIIVDGTTIILAPGATKLTYGSSGHSTTTALFPATTTRSQSITAASASVGVTGGNKSPQETGAHQGAGQSIKASLGLCICALLFAIFST